MSTLKDCMLLWENSFDSIIITPHDGNITAANSAACTLLNVCSEEIYNYKFKEFISPNDDSNFDLWEEMNRNGRAKGEMCLVRKGGETFSGEISSVKFQDESESSKFLIIIRDITEQKKKERDLQMNQELFSLFMRYSPIYTYIKDTSPVQSRVLQASDNFIEMINIPGQQMIGKTMDELFPPEFAQKITADDWNVVCEGKVLKVDEDLNGRNYTTIKFPITIGEKTLLAGFTIDITDRKQAQMQLQEITEELKDLNFTKDKFFSIVAHDLKSPFQGLIGYSRILSQEYNSLSEEEKIGFIKSIEELSNNTYKLVTNLLEWSRIQTGKMVYNPEEFNLFVELYPAISLKKQLAKKKNIHFNYSIDNSIFVSADKNMLETIVRNLLSNAIKFTRPGGTISLSAEVFDDCIQIAVTDNGVGIRKENLESMFNIGSHLSTTGTDKEMGTGLGLLLCKEMIEMHKGRIWAESEFGKGTTFYFTIPKSM